MEQVTAQTWRSATATERLRHLTALQKHLMGLQSLLTGHQNLRTGLQQPLMTPQPQTATTRRSRTATTRHQAATTQADVSGQLNCPRKPGTSTPTSTLPTRCTAATALHNLPSTTPLLRPNINLVEACRSSTRFMAFGTHFVLRHILAHFGTHESSYLLFLPTRQLVGSCYALH